MDPSAWELNGKSAVFLTHLGQKALLIDDGGTSNAGSNIVTVKDLEFANGTIEYDIAFTEKTRFTAIHFRRKNEANSEHFYLRGIWRKDHKINTGLQYAAVLNGVNLWDLSGGYQSNANMNQEGWNHVKLVVKDRQLLAYVNDMTVPALYVPLMDGNWKKGRVTFDGSAYIANLTVTPDATPGLVGSKGFDPTFNDSRFLRNWQVTEPIDLPTGQEPTQDVLPTATTSWSTIAAERHGLVNISRRYGATPRGTRRMVWLKATIKASKDQVRKLDFGFSDEVYVYLNGKPLYQDKNLYNTPGMKTPRGRCSLENSRIELPLGEGDNELLIGVTNFFFGWGIMARFDDVEGLRY
jgi:hypothetical protein